MCLILIKFWSLSDQNRQIFCNPHIKLHECIRSWGPLFKKLSSRTSPVENSVMTMVCEKKKKTSQNFEKLNSKILNMYVCIYFICAHVLNLCVMWPEVNVGCLYQCSVPHNFRWGLSKNLKLIDCQDRLASKPKESSCLSLPSGVVCSTTVWPALFVCLRMGTWRFLHAHKAHCVQSSNPSPNTSLLNLII